MAAADGAERASSTPDARTPEPLDPDLAALAAALSVEVARSLDARAGDERLAHVREPSPIERAALAASIPPDAPVLADDLLVIDVRFRGPDGPDDERFGRLVAPRSFSQAAIDAAGGVRAGFAERAAVAADRREPARELAAVFVANRAARAPFPLEHVLPAHLFRESAARRGLDVDEASMRANNTSAFAARRIRDTGRWSRHAVGAVDLAPFYNPQLLVTDAGAARGRALSDLVRGDVDAGLAAVAPRTAGRFAFSRGALDHPMLLRESTPIVAGFLARGWSWGGLWTRSYDWQHFSPGIE